MGIIYSGLAATRINNAATVKKLGGFKVTFIKAMTGGFGVMTSLEIRESFEIAVVDQRTGKRKIGKMKGDAFVVQGMPFSDFNGREIWDWTHTDRTVLIIL